MTRIIIIGGGFAGVKCAQTLSQKLGDDTAQIVLFNTENHLVFTPLLADVIGSSVNPLDVTVPLRQLLPSVHCRTEEVLRIDTVKNAVEYRNGDGQIHRLTYDHLVLACGNIANLHAVPGMADHAFPLKTVGDAVALRSHVMEQLEKAETCETQARRRWHLSLTVVGAGYSGVEAAGEINDLVRGSARYFKNFSADDVKVTVIHSREEILPEISASLRQFARRKMEKQGIRILLNSRVASAKADGVVLSDGELIPGGTIICTIGSSPAPIIEQLNVPKQKGRIETDTDLRVRGLHNVWTTGDCGLILNAFDNQPSPPTGQFAERQGKQCAENILRVLRREPTRPFSFKPLGQLCSIGGHSAVAELGRLHVSGFIAWLLWRAVYLFKLPSWARRVQVGFDWAWVLLFPRDLAHLRARQTDRVSRAHYRAGDLIARAGDAASSLSLIEGGHVDLLSPGDDRIINILGPGSFFGEKALVSNENLPYSVRARTDVKLVMMGRNVFTQVSNSLAPLRDAIADTLNRRTLDFAQVHPEAHEVLRGLPISHLMEPVHGPIFYPDSTMAEIGRAFASDTHEFFYICAADKSLLAIVTLTDWMQILSQGAKPQTKIGPLLKRPPITVHLDDGAANAATILREHRVKNLPVVTRGDNRLVGAIRARRLMAYVFDRIHGAAQSEAPELKAAA